MDLIKAKCFIRSSFLLIQISIAESFKLSALLWSSVPLSLFLTAVQSCTKGGLCGLRTFKRTVITFFNSSGSRNLLFSQCLFFFFFERYIFANCKWNSNPWEFKLISRFGIYITQVCLKHAKIISSPAQGCPRDSKPEPK